MKKELTIRLQYSEFPAGKCNKLNKVEQAFIADTLTIAACCLT